MQILPDWFVQVLQVASVLVFAPLLSGVIARVEAVIEQRHGPRALQPYHDIAKHLRKETVLPGPLFPPAPYVAFAGDATVPLLMVATDQQVEAVGVGEEGRGGVLPLDHCLRDVDAGALGAVADLGEGRLQVAPRHAGGLLVGRARVPVPIVTEPD